MKTRLAESRPGALKPPSVPKGFTLVEMTIGLSVLAMVLILVAETGLWTLQEQGRSAVRQDALEVAANILESARVVPWNDLTPEWAARQQLPEALASRLDGGKLTVRVEPEEGQPRSKRLTVEIHWKLATGPARPVHLVSLFTARSAALTGGKP